MSSKYSVPVPFGVAGPTPRVIFLIFVRSTPVKSLKAISHACQVFCKTALGSVLVTVAVCVGLAESCKVTYSGKLTTFSPCGLY